METSSRYTTPPPLTLTVGGRSYTVAPTDSPITIGREFPAQVLLADPRISRAHLRIETAAGHWVGVDLSRNGVYVNQVRQASFPITQPLTVHLGAPNGIPVTLDPTPGRALDSATDDGPHLATDPDLARAGAAVAARRAQLDLSRRHLARDRVINAGTLSALERGEHWPKATTLRKLEEVLEWSPGTISRIRHGDQQPTTDPAETTVALTGSIAGEHMAQASTLALEAIRARIKLLPDPVHPSFADTAGSIFDELRRLEQLTSRIAHNTTGVPALTIALGAVRSTYRDLMLAAAESPHATLGQRLYAARHRSGLSAEETANAAGLPAETVANAEGGQPISATDVAAIEALLDVLSAPQSP